jgi:hypothetical protein
MSAGDGLREKRPDSDLASWSRQGGFGPARSEFDATDVPAPVASSVESCSHLANHQASTSHDGITFSTAFLTPRTNALAMEHAIPRSWSSRERLCAKNSSGSTLPVRIRDFRDVPSLFTVINDPCSRMYCKARSRRSSLTREVHTAQKAAQMAGQRNNTHCQKFHGEAIARQEIRPSPSTEMHPPHQPDQDARNARKY